jgi:hypothetical protein
MEAAWPGLVNGMTRCVLSAIFLPQSPKLHIRKKIAYPVSNSFLLRQATRKIS